VAHVAAEMVGEGGKTDLRATHREGGENMQ
jgi:hypothetical protein